MPPRDFRRTVGARQARKASYDKDCNTSWHLERHCSTGSTGSPMVRAGILVVWVKPGQRYSRQVWELHTDPTGTFAALGVWPGNRAPPQVSAPASHSWPWCRQFRGAACAGNAASCRCATG